MYHALIVLHTIFAVLLIVIVLLQSGGKGASMGAIFGGGGSQTLFGSAGPAGFLSKLTTVFAVAFMITSLTIAIIAARRVSKSIVEKTPVSTQQTQPLPVPADKGQEGGLPKGK